MEKPSEMLKAWAKGRLIEQGESTALGLIIGLIEKTEEEVIKMHTLHSRVEKVIPICERIFDFMKEAAESDSPRMIDFGVGINDVEAKGNVVLKVWASNNVDSPMTRIEQLLAENDELKRQLTQK